jgi:uncharacterized protein (TIGR03382 family)
MNRLLLAMTVVMVPAVALAVTPANGAAPTLTPVTINAGAGDQYDPHVSGDFAAYTSDDSIRYYRFSSAADAVIPMGASARDLLSDISGSKVVFSRVITGVKTAVMVFDINTAAAPIELDPALGTTRIGSAIGGNTVAYVDFGLHGNGELVIHDLVTSTSIRVTNDVAFDGNPSVSPDGNVVTWEHCATSTSNCDVWQAVRTGAVWNVGITMDSANPEANPDTNGALVVYDSVRASNADLFWRPITGGAEVQLQLPGVEANPSIAGNFIAFESRPTLLSTSDIYVYDLTANRLYQITTTPGVTEQLNDITLLGNGYVRVVWASDEDGFDQRNVKGATFFLGNPNACLARTVTLDASKTYNPSVYHDAVATMAPPMKFAIPASIPVTAGNSANDWVTLTYRLGNGAITTCKYRGGFSGPHPTSAYDLAKASKYVFHSCDTDGCGDHPEAGDQVIADRVTLHVNNGDTHKPSTAVRATLTEICPPATPPPPCPKPKHGNHGNGHGHGHNHHGNGHGHGHDHHDGDHDGDDDHGSRHDDLSAAPDATEKMGCSAAGGAPTILMLLAVAAWMLMNRRKAPAPVPVRVRK